MALSSTTIFLRDRLGVPVCVRTKSVRQKEHRERNLDNDGQIIEREHIYRGHEQEKDNETDSKRPSVRMTKKGRETERDSEREGG